MLESFTQINLVRRTPGKKARKNSRTSPRNLTLCFCNIGGIFRSQCCEDGFCVQAALEGDDTALCRGGESLRRSA